MGGLPPITTPCTINIMALGITAIAQDAIASLGTPTTVVSLTGLQITEGDH